MGGEYLASNILTPLNPIVWGVKCCLPNNDSPKRSKEGSQKSRGVIISRYTGGTSTTQALVTDIPQSERQGLRDDHLSTFMKLLSLPLATLHLSVPMRLSGRSLRLECVSIIPMCLFCNLL